MADINIFSQIKECYYKGEHYAVRDNGAIFRFPREGKRIRKDDNIWTWGIKNPHNGYMLLGEHRVHIIVATAFYGEKDSKIYVVDHIDINRCNNRVENLRWLTRLENVLLNPVTRKKITFLCDGDIINFIKNPACLKNLTGQDKAAFDWMRTVTPEEAQAAYNNVMRWAATPNKPHTYIETNDTLKCSWIPEIQQSQLQYQQNEFYINPIFQRAQSPNNALQMNWKTPTDFPCCPIESDSDALRKYYDKLKPGIVFSSNQYTEYTVVNAALIDNESSILVLSEDNSQTAIKPYALAKIHMSGIQFIHEAIKTFFTEQGALKQFTILQGLEWTGDDTVDDYC